MGQFDNRYRYWKDQPKDRLIERIAQLQTLIVQSKGADPTSTRVATYESQLDYLFRLLGDKREGQSKVEENIEVYDMGDKWADRYIVLIDTSIFGMSPDALAPNGVNMYYGEKDELLWPPDRAEKVSIEDLPKAVQEAINRRTMKFYEEEMNKKYPYRKIKFQRKGGNMKVQARIVKKGSEWCVVSEKGKNLGCYGSKEGAKKRLRQVEFFKHKKAVERKAFLQKGDTVLITVAQGDPDFESNGKVGTIDGIKNMPCGMMYKVNGTWWCESDVRVHGKGQETFNNENKRKANLNCDQARELVEQELIYNLYNFYDETWRDLDDITAKKIANMLKYYGATEEKSLEFVKETHKEVVKNSDEVLAKRSLK